MSEGSGANASGTGQATAQSTESVASVSQETSKETAKEAGEESTEETQEAEQEKVSHRDLWKNSLKEFAPDYDWNDENEDAYYEVANKYHETSQKKIKEMTEREEKSNAVNQKLLDTLNSYPEMADALRDMVKGATPIEALARNFDIANIQPVEGDPDYAEWDKALKERQAKKKEKDDYYAEMQKNIEQSATEIKTFAEQQKMSDEDTMKFMSAVDEMVASIYKGKITTKLLGKLFKAYSYDGDVADAEKRGLVAGKNEKIEVIKETVSKQKGDGIPKISSSSAEKEVAAKPKNTWLDAMDKAMEKDSRFDFNRNKQ